ncbi:MAG: elongation factor G [Alphaproteobacteria bacterium]
MSEARSTTPRCVALVGPYLSGKTTLLESLLYVSGSRHRKGTIKDGTTVGDTSAEARARQMGVEVNVAHGEFMGDQWRFLDCPGSVELLQEAMDALSVADAAVVVCEPEIDRAAVVAPILRYLEDIGVPHVLFINKMDNTENRVRDVLAELQHRSTLPLVLRQVPIRDGDGVSGYCDLVSERAYRYKEGEASDLIPLPEDMTTRTTEARAEMLESLADFDDKLLEKLIEDTMPAKGEVYADLARDLGQNLIVPVVLGAAQHDHGVRRLLKLLRHETPEVSTTALRKGIEPDGEALAQVFKTAYVPHVGKLALARVFRGTIRDGDTLGGVRVSGVLRVQGAETTKLSSADAGEVVAFGRMEEVQAGAVLTPSGAALEVLGWPEALSPVFAQVIGTENRADDVKLSGALHKLCEEDRALSVVHVADTQQMLLQGQGEMHLSLAFDRLASKYNLKTTRGQPDVPYKETIRKSIAEHGRFKRQTGGHGQFGDIHVEIRPLPRGKGFVFEDKIFGGHIPRQYIPAVEEGVKDFLVRGPLGFPVVDIAVTLTDGSYHSVDSSEAAFKQAARIAMSEGLPKCDPVLLEPIYAVTLSVPSEFTSKANTIVSSRRGRILGFDAKAGWPGWDEVTAHMPQAELSDLIIELRSATLGLGSFTMAFDHLVEISGKEAERIVQARAGAAAAAQ